MCVDARRRWWILGCLPGCAWSTHQWRRSCRVAIAEDALVAALGAYIQSRENIPPPSPVIDGQRRIAVRSIVAAKLALYSAMRAQRITKTELARRMGLSEGAIRKLLNLDHRSHIGQVERALRIVGRSLVLTDEPVLQLN